MGPPGSFFSCSSCMSSICKGECLFVCLFIKVSLFQSCLFSSSVPYSRAVISLQFIGHGAGTYVLHNGAFVVKLAAWRPPRGQEWNDFCDDLLLPLVIFK